MKNLTLISFVGVDHETKFSELLKFNDFKMIYEFGILYSDSKTGNNKRYPAYEFCKEYLEWAKANKVSSSLHLCGSSIERYLNEDQDVITLCTHAGRIQLNLNIKKYDDYNSLSDRIISVATKYNHHIILQKNKSKKEFNKIILDKNPNISLSLLHDSSGGFGREITIVSPPDNTYFTGYAGGINRSNVLKIISLIEATNNNNKLYYIDMESGVRINNLFSIDECDKIRSLINKLG